VDRTTLPRSPIADSSLLSALFMLGEYIGWFGLIKQNTTLSSAALPTHWPLLSPHDYLPLAPDHPRSNPQPRLGRSRGMATRHEWSNRLGADSLCAHRRRI